MRKLLLVLPLLAAPCYALPPESHHQTELLPAMQFTEECNSKGGSNVRKGVELVRRTVSASGLVAVIYGRITQITCTMPEKPPEELETLLPVSIFWYDPTERVDGTIIQPGEIGYYEISINSEPYIVVQGNSWAGALERGIHSFSVLHVDSSGQRSDITSGTFEVSPKTPSQ